MDGAPAWHDNSAGSGALGQKVAIVTGASSGIGAAIATQLARHGARVIAVGRDHERLERCADGIRASGGQCVVITAELLAEGAPARVLDEALAAFGRLDVVVHSAGIFRMQPLADAGADVLDDQYALNVRVPYLLTRAALPHLGDGSTVIFVSSNLAQVGMAEAAAYCASKGAVDAMARALAVELAPRVRVNTVAPGIVRTPMTHRLDSDPAQRQAALDRTPAGRLGEPADIAAAVAYLASDHAGYMVGSTVVIDGGWNAY